MKDKVLSIVAKVFNVPAESLTPESSPANIPGWDSLKHMTLILSLEEVFGVEFSDRQIAEMVSLAAILRNVPGGEA